MVCAVSVIASCHHTSSDSLRQWPLLRPPGLPPHPTVPSALPFGLIPTGTRARYSDALNLANPSSTTQRPVAQAWGSSSVPLSLRRLSGLVACPPLVSVSLSPSVSQQASTGKTRGRSSNAPRTVSPPTVPVSPSRSLPRIFLSFPFPSLFSSLSSPCLLFSLPPFLPLCCSCCTSRIFLLRVACSLFGEAFWGGRVFASTPSRLWLSRRLVVWTISSCSSPRTCCWMAKHSWAPTLRFFGLLLWGLHYVPHNLSSPVADQRVHRKDLTTGRRDTLKSPPAC